MHNQNNYFPKMENKRRSFYMFTDNSNNAQAMVTI